MLSLILSMLQVYGFAMVRPADTFAHLVQQIYTDHNILLLGCQIKGRVQLAPMKHVVESGTVCFAMAEDENAIEPVHDGSDWAAKMRDERNTSFAVDPDSPKCLEQVVALWELTEVSSRSGIVSKRTQGAPARGDFAAAYSEPDRDLSSSQGSVHGLAKFQIISQAAQSPSDNSSNTANTALRQRRRPSLEVETTGAATLELDAVICEGGHIVVLALGLDPWAQVEVFSKMINRPKSLQGVGGMPTRNIVVLYKGDTPSASTQASLNSKGVHTLEGNAQDPTDLVKVGIQSALAIVSLAGQPFPGENPKAADASTAVASLLVEKIIFMETGSDRFSIFEWIFPPNVGLIPRYPISIVPVPSNDKLDDGLAKEFDLSHSVRYAAGRVITAVTCGALCAQAYFIPGRSRSLPSVQ